MRAKRAQRHRERQCHRSNRTPVHRIRPFSSRGPVTSFGQGTARSNRLPRSGWDTLWAAENGREYVLRRCLGTGAMWQLPGSLSSACLFLAPTVLQRMPVCDSGARLRRAISRLGRSVPMRRFALAALVLSSFAAGPADGADSGSILILVRQHQRALRSPARLGVYRSNHLARSYHPVRLRHEAHCPSRQPESPECRCIRLRVRRLLPFAPGPPGRTRRGHPTPPRLSRLLPRCFPRRRVPAIRRPREMGVQSILPTHCTGELATRLFREAFGKRFLRGGAGTRIPIDQLARRAAWNSFRRHPHPRRLTWLPLGTT